MIPETPSYLKFNPKDDIWGQNMQDIIDAIKKELKEDDIYVDCGAHIGFICIPILKEVSPQKAFLFEPNPNLSSQLRENLEENKITNYSVIGSPLWNEVKEVDFILSGAQSSILNRGQGTDGILKVTTTTLDNELSNTTGDIVIKMDVECSEPQVFEGLKNNIHRLRFAVVEIMAGALQRDFGVNLEKFFTDFQNQGFTITELDGSPTSIPKILNGLKTDIILKR